MFGRQQGGNRFMSGNRPRIRPAPLVTIDHLLPLPLQDFCLLRVISDLDGYPVDLLASLPRWLRYRLLNSLPALDLCRLDHTAVATGIDVNLLWEARLQILTEANPAGRGGQRAVSRSTSQSATSVQTDQSHFQLDLPQILTLKPFSRFRLSWDNRQVVKCSPSQKEKITLAFNDVREYPGMETSSARDKFMANIVSNFLYHVMDNTHHLVSIPGEHLLLNLVFASHHQLVTPGHSHFVLRKQATPLTMKHVGPPPSPVRHRGRNQSSMGSRWRNLYDNYDGYNNSGCALTPHRLICSFVVKGSRLRLLSLLVNDCGVRPTSAHIYVNKISQEIADLLYTARVARENGFKITDDCTACNSVMHHLLSRVVILKLHCQKYAEIGIMIEMIEAVTADQKQCQLQYIFCTMPDLYADIVHPLSAVFSLQNFSQLSLDLDEVYLPSLGKLLFIFLTAPCPGTQKLFISIKGKATAYHSTVLPIAELATLSMKGTTLPHCAIHHKMLEIFPQHDITRILYILLQWPIARLNELVLSVKYKYLHLCALHPNLQVMKLVIIVDEKTDQDLLDTVQEDFVALLKIPTLEEFSIAAFWDRYKEAKAGVVQGLRHRSSLPPLRKIHIDEAAPGECTEEEYRDLWKAIFSLPQLDQLEVVLNAVAMAVLFKYLNTVFASWVDTASGTKLKTIDFQSLASASEDEIKLISHFTQTHSFLTYEDLF
jgi:hypothetical protein